MEYDTAARSSSGADIRTRGNRDPGQVQCAPMDAWLHRGLKASIFRGHGQGWQFRPEGPAAGNLHDHRLAGEVRDSNRKGDDWRWRSQNPGLRFQVAIGVVDAAWLLRS